MRCCRPPPRGGRGAAARRRLVPAPESGFLSRLAARAVGMAAWRLGAGRARKEDPVSAAAGVICLAKPGEQVSRGQPVLELRADDEARFGRAAEVLAGAIEIGARPAAPGSVVLERIEP